jgi:ribosomal protein L28
MPPRITTEWAAPRGRMHRAFKGLYANRMIQFGNKVSFAENKSRRVWRPNVQVKSMYSETLGRALRFRMTTHAMRCVRKAGGIDEYLVKAKDAEIKYPKAIEYKREIKAIRRERIASRSATPATSTPVTTTGNATAAAGPLLSTTPVTFRSTGWASSLTRPELGGLAFFTRGQ